MHVNQLSLLSDTANSTSKLHIKILQGCDDFFELSFCFLACSQSGFTIMYN